MFKILNSKPPAYADIYKHVVETTLKCGANGLLFAQMQADSEIDGTFFEGNSVAEVLPVLQDILKNIKEFPLIDFISNASYDQFRSELTNDDYFKHILKNDSYYRSVNVTILCDSLKKNGIVTLPYSIGKHLIILEFVLTTEYLTLHVYNTGLGLNEHDKKIIDGKRHYHCCKSFQIAYMAITNPAESSDTNITAVITMLFPEPKYNNVATKQVQAFYMQAEKLIMLCKGSKIHNNNSSLIIGQRSGTCVWKALFRYVREKMKVKYNDAQIDLLLKYDIKLRSMLDLKHTVDKHLNKFSVSQEILQCILFACQNNARLLLKLHSKGLISDRNVQSALDLHTSIEDLLPTIQAKVLKYKYIAVASFAIYPTRLDRPSAANKKDVQVIESHESRYPAGDLAACLVSLAKLSDNLKTETKLQKNDFILGFEHVMLNIQEYVAKLEFTDAEAVVKFIQSLSDISVQYYKYAREDAQAGFSEVRQYCMLMLNIVALQASAEIFNYIHERCRENEASILSAYKIFFSGISAAQHTVITSPTLSRKFHAVTSMACELAIKYKILTKHSSNEAINPLLLALKDSGPSLVRLEFLKNIFDICFRACYIPGLFYAANTFLDESTQRYFYAPKENASDQSVYLNSTSQLLTFLESTPQRPIIYRVQRLEPATGATPIDKYILGEIAEIYSRGLVSLDKMALYNKYNHKDYINSSDYAYMPRGTYISKEESQVNLLQSMFAEKGISVLRLKEFIYLNYHNFNKQLYIDATFMLLFTNGTIEKQIQALPHNLLEFLCAISHPDLINQDALDSYSNRAILPFKLFHMCAYYALEFLDFCNDATIKQQIISKIATTSLLDYLNAKITAAGTQKSTSESVYLKLLAIKILYYNIQHKIHVCLEREQLMDLLNVHIQMEANLNVATPIQELNLAFNKHILTLLTTQFAAAEIASFRITLANIYGYNPEEIYNLSYDVSNKSLTGILNDEPLSYCFTTGIAILGNNTLTRTPKHFINNSGFNATFMPPPEHVYVLSPNEIMFMYGARCFKAYAMNFNDVVIQTDDLQLYLPNEKNNSAFCGRLPITLLDQQYDLYLDTSGKSGQILNRKTKETLFAFKNTANLTRLLDNAKFIESVNSEMYRTLSRFESPMFIQTWRLIDGKIQFILPRYGVMLICIDPHNNEFELITNSIAPKYTLVTDAQCNAKFPHAIIFKTQTNKLFVWLPRQHYICKSSSVDANDNSLPIILLDTIGAAEYARQRSDLKYENAIAQPHNFTLQQVADYTEFELNGAELLCKNVDDYFHVAYYLIGQKNYYLAKECLESGYALNNSKRASAKWLRLIIIALPFSIKSLETDLTVTNFFTTCDLALRTLAIYYQVKTLTHTKQKFPDLQVCVEIIARYYNNMNNLRADLKLSIAQELELLGYFDSQTQCDFMTERLKQLNTKHNSNIIKAKIIQDENVSLKITKCANNFMIRKSSDYCKASIGPQQFNILLDDESLNKDDYFILALGIIIFEYSYDYLYLQLKATLLSYTIKHGYKDNTPVGVFLYILAKLESEPSCRAFLQEQYQKIPNDWSKNINDFLQPIIAAYKDCPLIITLRKSDTNVIMLQDTATTNAAVFAPIPVTIGFLDEESDPLPDPEIKINKEDINATWLNSDDLSMVEHVAMHRADYLAGIRKNILVQNAANAAAIVSQYTSSHDLTNLELRSQQLAFTICELFNKAHTICEVAIQKSGMKPKSSLEGILRVFIRQDFNLYARLSFMNEAECANVNQLIFEYLFVKTEIQNINKSTTNIPRAYANSDAPRLIAICLLFEYVNNVRIYKQQFINIKQMIYTGSNVNAILQMAMGAGKTTVLSPIITMANATHDRLSIYIVPEALFNTTATALSVTGNRIFGILPQVIIYSRNDLNSNCLNGIRLQIIAALQSRSFIIMTPNTLHALHLSRIECALNHASDENTACKSILSEMFQIFKQAGICLADEIDRVLDLNTEYNYASIDYEYINDRFPQLINIVLDFYSILERVALPYAVTNTALDIILGAVRKPIAEEWPLVLTKIADLLYAEFFATFNIDKGLLLQAILGEISLEPVAASLNDAKRDSLAIFKYELTNLFRITVGSVLREEYGAAVFKPDTFANVVAIPYERLAPIVGSEFSDPLTTINYTIQAWLYRNTTIETALLETFFDDIYVTYNKMHSDLERQNFNVYYAEIFGCVTAEFNVSQICDPAFIEDIRKSSYDNIRLKLHLLRNYILPTIYEHKYEIQSNAFTLNNTFDIVNGFSGTLEYPDMFKPNMIISNKEESLGTDGAVIDVLINRKTEVITADHNLSTVLQLTNLVMQMSATRMKLHALIDLGAAFKDLGDNLHIAKLLAEQFAKIAHFNYLTHILFFTDNHLQALNISSLKVQDLSNTNADSIFNITGAAPNAYFTFYDQAHTIGIDFKHEPDAHAILTLGEKTQQAGLLQAVMRMRGFTVTGKQTMHIYVSLASRNMLPNLPYWDLTAVLRFVLNNTLNATLDTNFHTAQLLMQDCLTQRAIQVALQPEVDAKKYFDLLTAARVGNLYSRYGRFSCKMNVGKLLQLYRDQLLIRARSFNFDSVSIENECNAIIVRYLGKCAAFVNTALSAAEINSSHIVTRSKQASDVEQETELAAVAKAKPEYTVSDYDKTFESFNKFISNFVDSWQTRQLTAIMPYGDVRKNINISSAPNTVFMFYSATHASVGMASVTKNVYYIAEYCSHGSTKYFLISEEMKNECIFKLSSNIPRGFMVDTSQSWSSVWLAMGNWVIPAQSTFNIYNKQGLLEYSAKGDAVTEVDPLALLHLHVFNADAASLLQMIDSRHGDMVQEYFANDRTKTINYMRDKISVFCKYQDAHFKLLIRRLELGATVSNKTPPLPQFQNHVFQLKPSLKLKNNKPMHASVAKDDQNIAIVKPEAAVIRCATKQQQRKERNCSSRCCVSM